MMNFSYKYGFTIMEVLLALVISCVVMVASVPIITVQKSSGHVEKWHRTSNNADIFYGTPRDTLKVGIGTSAPLTRLHVRGYEKNSTEAPVMTINNSKNRAATIIFANSRLEEVGRIAVNSQGDDIAIGKNAITNIETVNGAVRNLAIGQSSSFNIVGHGSQDNVTIGNNSLNTQNNLHESSVYIGANAGHGVNFSSRESNEKNNYNFVVADHHWGAMGKNAVQNIIIGDEAGSRATGKNNIFIGLAAGHRASGSNNIFIGAYAGKASKDSNRIIIGDMTGVTTTYAKGYTTQSYPSPGYVDAEYEVLVNRLGNVVTKTTFRFKKEILDIIGVAVSPNGSNDNNAIEPNLNAHVGGVIDIKNGAATIHNADVDTNVLRTDTAANYTQFSDKRYKNLVGEYKKSLEDIKKLKVYSYTYKADGKNGQETVGIIAQDIKDIFPDALMKRKGIYVVDYNYISMANLNALTELRQKNKELRTRIQALKKAVQQSQSCSCN